MTASAEVTLTNANGLHARPAHLFVQTANSFASELWIRRTDMDRVDGKSIMGVMMLAAARGSRIEVTAEGNDAEAALDALDELVRDRFGEGQ